MLVARILLILVIFSVAICLGAYLVKGDKRYLRLIGQIVKYAFLLLLAWLTSLLAKHLSTRILTQMLAMLAFWVTLSPM